MSENIQGSSVEGHNICLMEKKHSIQNYHQNPCFICRPGFELIKKVEFHFASVVLVHLFEVNARVIMKDELIRSKNSK